MATEVPVCRDEGFELRRRQRQKLAVLDACPSFITDGRDVMPRDQRREVVRKSLIKQDAHPPPMTLEPFRERPRPARA
jgi:hypothetical protein